MSHLHVPDGLLPLWLWGPSLLLAIAVLAWPQPPVSRQRVAYHGALGGLMLAAMAVPLGPLEYHLTLAAPVGILLGARGAFEVSFVVSAILALMGHGGLTVVGLNAMVMGACAAVASLVYRRLADRLAPPWAMAWSTALGQAVGGALWLVIVVMAVRLGAGQAQGRAHAHAVVAAGVAIPLWIVGLLIESLVAFGIGRFLARVHPALLVGPGRAQAPAAEAT